MTFTKFCTAAILALCLFIPLSEAIAVDGSKTPAASRAKLSGELDFVVDRIVASVDGDPLTTADLRHYLESMGQPVPAEFHAGDPAVDRALRELIGSVLLEKEAQKTGVTVSDQEIDAYIAEVRQQNGVDEATFRKMLEERHLTDAGYRLQARREILRARVISQRVKSKVSVSEDEIDARLGVSAKSEPEEIPEGQVALEQLFFPLPQNASAEQQQQAKELAQRASEALASGAKLSAVDQQHYTNLGAIDPNDMQEELRAAIEKLEVGEVTAVLETSAGFFILRRLSNDIASHESDADPRRERVRQELLSQRFQEELQKYIDEELPKQYVIETKL